MASVKDFWSWLIGTKESAVQVVKATEEKPQPIAISKTDGVTIETVAPAKKPRKSKKKA